MSYPSAWRHNGPVQTFAPRTKKRERLPRGYPCRAFVRRGGAGWKWEVRYYEDRAHGDSWDFVNTSKAGEAKTEAQAKRAALKKMAKVCPLERRSRR